MVTITSTSHLLWVLAVTAGRAINGVTKIPFTPNAQVIFVVVVVVRLGQGWAKAKPKAITEFTLNHHHHHTNFLGTSRQSRKLIFGMKPNHSITR